MDFSEAPCLLQFLLICLKQALIVAVNVEFKSSCSPLYVMWWVVGSMNGLDEESPVVDWGN